MGDLKLSLDSLVSLKMKSNSAAALHIRHLITLLHISVR